MPELKPCPICGGEAVVSASEWTFYEDLQLIYPVEGIRISCKNCHNKTNNSYVSIESAEKEWNKLKKECKMSELKPCPFCGSKDIEINEVLFENHYQEIHCNNCKMIACYPRDMVKEDVIKAWNTRS